MSAVTHVPAADPAQAAAHFAARLAYETDVSDVAAALASGDPGFVLVDSRGKEAWDQGRVPGAVHLPATGIAARAPIEIPANSQPRLFGESA